MRCRTCDYPLWNVKARQCPDCGAAFKPSDFTFEPGKVRYLCPHCSTAYYGTSETGHLEPPEFTCVTCQQAVRMDEMAIAPLEGEATVAMGAANPWLERTSLFRPFFRSVWEVLVRPQQFGRTIPLAAELGQAVGFFAMGTMASLVVNLLMQACILGAVGYGLSQVAPKAPNPFGAAGIGRQLTQGVLLGLTVSVLWVLIESVLAHVVFRITRPRATSRAVPMGRGVQAYLYGGGAGAALMCLQAIPCCGSVVGFAWFGLSIFVIGMLLRETYGISTARAMWTMVGVRVITVIFFIIAMIGVALTVPQVMGLPPGLLKRVLAGRTVQTTGTALSAYRSANGAWPATPIDPFSSDTLGLIELVELTRVSGPAAIGGLSGGAIFTDDGTLFAKEQASLAGLIVPGKPFRLSGAVFVYPIASAAPGEWLVIADAKGISPIVRVVTATGEVVYSKEEFVVRLAEENARRATAGEAPLPDPAAVPDLLNTPLPASPDAPPTPTSPPPKRLERESTPPAVTP